MSGFSVPELLDHRSVGKPAALSRPDFTPETKCKF
jgi:hypothetical protein